MQNRRSKKANNQDSLSNIPSAYDLKKERQLITKLNCQSKTAIAWMEGERIEYRLTSKFTRQGRDSSRKFEIYLEWIADSCVAEGRSKLNSNRSKKKKPLSDYVQCLVSSSGSGWSVWKYTQVSKAILNSARQRDKLISGIIPIEHTIFDPDKAANAWHQDQEKPAQDRLIEFGKSLIMDAARIYALGETLIEDFEPLAATFNPMLKTTNHMQAAVLIKNSVRAAQSMLYEAAKAKYTGKENIDPAIAMRQGYLIGRWLNEAESIISNQTAMKVAAYQGNSGQRISKFWQWIFENPQFNSMPPKEIFGKLEGMPDTENPKKSIVIKDYNKLQRHDGSLLKESSFISGFSRAAKKHKASKI